MRIALNAYLDRLRKTDGDHVKAVSEAAEALYHTPWDVVKFAGTLARCKVGWADKDMALATNLKIVSPDSSNAVEHVPAGSPYPIPMHAGRRSRGTYDTPVDMARRVVQAAQVAVEGPCRTGLDTACGTGSFLVAMLEAGIKDVWGTDIDEAALAVARIAAPKAKIELRDALAYGPKVDLVVGNPPFVPPERQDKYMRKQLRQRFPWLKGRFDLVIPFASVAVDRCREGGAVGLVMPSAALVQKYGSTLRRRWIERHEIVDLSGPYPFPGASVEVMLVVIRAGRGPKPLPIFMIPPEELLRLEDVPFNPELQPGDVDLVEKVRRASFPLGDFCLVDTGVVAHGPHGGKAALIHEDGGKGLVPYADAKDFFQGHFKWLDYQPSKMHRPKQPEMFENPKIVIQRIRGRNAVKAAIDWDGVYLGHTCTVVFPRERLIPLDRILDLVKSPLIDGLTRIEHGQRLDLYPKDVRNFPVPKMWIEKPHLPLATAFGLSDDEIFRLEMIAER